jgi:short-subunit dehydrogenase involved in D-alanine esterification of teichoic acids
MRSLGNDVPEIGFGMTAEFIHASRADLDESFERMNRGV